MERENAKNSIREYLKDKRVLIWGYGLEGKSAESFIRAHAKVRSLDVYEGGQEGIDEEAYDLVIKSPGIREGHWNEKYTSVTELFLREFGARTIGITGTKGKSTTASLLYAALKNAQERPVVLVGNIGIPCLDAYEEIGDDTIIVFELSCHQLDHLRVSPHVAVFLNLYEEHLDRYDTMERYFAAKKSITTHQGPEDIYYAGAQVPPIETIAETRVIALPENAAQQSHIAEGTNAAPESLPAEGTNAAPEPCMFQLQLSGNHNQYNAYVVYTIATEQYGCDPARVREALAAFTGLPHRLQYLGKAGGIDYYDDSISTIPEASIAALGSIANAKTILIGGMDRGIDYTVLEDYILAHPEYAYICMYDSGRRIYEAALQKNAGRASGAEGKAEAALPYLHYREDLAAAVDLAKEITPESGACILSPAAASYGYFKNFEERGDVFRSMVV